MWYYRFVPLNPNKQQVNSFEFGEFELSMQNSIVEIEI